MRKFKILLMLLFYCMSSYSQDSKTAKILVFRNDNYLGKSININLMLNNKLFEKIQNASYKEITVPADSIYVVSIQYSRTQMHSFKAKADSVYVFEVRMLPYLISYSVELSPRELYFAEQNIVNYKLFNLDMPIPSTFLKNRFGLFFNMGGGFSKVDLFEATNGEKSSISFGGGFGIKFSAATEIKKWYELGIDLGYQLSELTPVLRDAKSDFSRKYISVYPSLIKSFGRFKTTKLRVGVGPVYYFDNKMNIDLTKVSYGSKATWQYNNSLGVQSFIALDFLSRKNLSASMGLNYYNVEYKYNSTNGAYYPIDKRLINADGTGIDFVFGFSYLF